MKTLPLPEAWSARAIIVSEVENPEEWFSDEELKIANAFPLPKRRAEWLLSRIAAKELARRSRIANDGRSVFVGRPRLIVNGKPSAYVSLSHSVGLAAAAIDSYPIGIDIERPRPLSESAGHLFLTDEEQDVMRQCSIADRLIHFWAAKEAIYKQHQGKFQTLRRVPLHFRGESETGLVFDGAETYRGEVIAALTLPTS